MILQHPSAHRPFRGENASVLVIVLWICLALVSISLYFAHSMTYELRAADNRVNGVAAEQAIEGAARYINLVLANYATNGTVPDPSQFKCAAVALGDAHFWLIGRDPAGGNSTEPYFGLVDEGAKLNINTANTNTLSYLPGMGMDFAQAIVDWRNTNTSLALDYSSLGYAPKYAPFESIDELRLVYGATVDLLAGEDINRNGVLDASEKDLNGNGELDPGLFEYLTVWTREPNFHADGIMLTNINTATQNDLTTLLRNASVSSPDSRGQTIYSQIHPRSTSGPPTPRPFNGIFDFAAYWRSQGWSADDFARITDDITTATNTYFRGRVNVNTAGAEVLTALFSSLNNVDEQTAASAAQTLLTYRDQNPGTLNAITWVYDALGNNQVVTALRAGNFITTKSYQFTADIAAVGAYGRGYRRVKFLFDLSDGPPKIVYRQDLSRLGWALGDKARNSLLANNTQ
ncbi:MAG TPA: helix-hairpin-helix domain-containing protein [Verrucomicrobiae bacterium]